MMQVEGSTSGGSFLLLQLGFVGTASELYKSTSGEISLGVLWREDTKFSHFLKAPFPTILNCPRHEWISHMFLGLLSPLFQGGRVVTQASHPVPMPLGTALPQEPPVLLLMVINRKEAGW
jgi:hypothetical protein